jgi:hypothetical protein
MVTRESAYFCLVFKDVVLQRGVNDSKSRRQSFKEDGCLYKISFGIYQFMRIES